MLKKDDGGFMLIKILVGCLVVVVLVWIVFVTTLLTKCWKYLNDMCYFITLNVEGIGELYEQHVENTKDIYLCLNCISNIIEHIKKEEGDK